MATEIRITDQHIINLVEAEQQETGEKTPTKTAGRLISEYVAIKKLTGAAKQQTERREPTPESSAA